VDKDKHILGKHVIDTKDVTAFKKYRLITFLHETVRNLKSCFWKNNGILQ